VQQRRGQGGSALRGIVGGRRAEPVRQPDRPRAARDGPAEQAEREQDAADHAVAARHQARTETHELLGRLDGTRQVTAATAGRQLSRPVIARQPGCLLGGRAQSGQDAVTMIEPGPGQRPEHR
jgi:hypothetical protein